MNCKVIMKNESCCQKKRRGRGRREKAENRVILSRKARLKLLTGEEATKGSGMRMLRILGFESDF